MDAPTIAAVLLAVWLALLTLVVLLLVRQLGLVTVRVDRTLDATSVINDGLPVGSPIPSAVQAAMGEAGLAQQAFVLVVSATCEPCRALAIDLGDQVAGLNVLALLTGAEEPATAVAEVFPSTIPVLRDPVASQLIADLHVSTTPFAFDVADGEVKGKSVVRGAPDFLRFAQTAAPDSNGSVPQLVEVNTNGS